jgi:hypothetical protein
MKGEEGESHYSIRWRTSTKRHWGTHLNLPERAIIMSQRVLDVVILIEDDPAWDLFGQSLRDL